MAMVYMVYWLYIGRGGPVAQAGWLCPIRSAAAWPVLYSWREPNELCIIINGVSGNISSFLAVLRNFLSATYVSDGMYH